MADEGWIHLISKYNVVNTSKIITWSVCLDKLHKFHAYKT